MLDSISVRVDLLAHLSVETLCEVLYSKSGIALPLHIKLMPLSSRREEFWRRRKAMHDQRQKVDERDDDLVNHF